MLTYGRYVGGIGVNIWAVYVHSGYVILSIVRMCV